MDTLRKTLTVIVLTFIMYQGSGATSCQEIGKPENQTIQVCRDQLLTSDRIYIDSDGAPDGNSITCWCSLRRPQSTPAKFGVYIYSSHVTRFDGFGMKFLIPTIDQVYNAIRSKTEGQLLVLENTTTIVFSKTKIGTKTAICLSLVAQGSVIVQCHEHELVAKRTTQKDNDVHQNIYRNTANPMDSSESSMNTESERSRDTTSLTTEPNQTTDVNSTPYVQKNSDEISTTIETVVGVAIGIFILGSVLGLLLTLTFQRIRKSAITRENEQELAERLRNTTPITLNSGAHQNETNAAIPVNVDIRQQMIDHGQQFEMLDPTTSDIGHGYESLHRDNGSGGKNDLGTNYYSSLEQTGTYDGRQLEPDHGQLSEAQDFRTRDIGHGYESLHRENVSGNQNYSSLEQTGTDDYEVM